MESGAFAPAPDAVRAVVEDLGFTLEDDLFPPLCAYLGLLAKWSRTANFTGPGRPLEILRTLVADSFYLADYLNELPLPPEPFCADLGAGAGLPGLPLRMVRGEGSYVLVEAREKRALFMRAFLAAHPLPGTSVYHGRAEDFLHGNANPDLIVSRAFMPVDKLLNFLEKYLKNGFTCILFTRDRPAAEKTALCDTIWTAAPPRSYTVGNDLRFLQAVQKNEPPVHAPHPE
ncbi:MAG: class I SAM-dependent methyltransferase [Desulfovibrio sp.]|jgi:16S rRNA (guanine527-N7)-methyltransferase|nr:class I SAM-dependent methyltransferase [Desulfovibrio sp.]